MRLTASRLLALAILVGLYALHPLAGVAALGAGFGYLAAQHRSRRMPRC